MRRFFTTMLVLMACASINATTKPQSVKSPDGNIEIIFNNAKPAMTYSVRVGRGRLINSSDMGLCIKADGKLIDRHFSLESVKYSSVDSLWTQPWGENKQVREHYNEMTLGLANPDAHLCLRFKVFNDGFAFRYEYDVDKADSLFVLDEYSEFNFASNGTTWSIPASAESYEFSYRQMPLSELENANTPMTANLNGTWFSVHEAALTDFPEMTLKKVGKRCFKAELAQWPDGIKAKFGSNKFCTPWRTVQIGKEAVDLINSELILNLNEACVLESTDWIKPMKYVGIWWGMHLGVESWVINDRHGATTENTLKYIDFAAENNIEGVLIEGWNEGWESWGGRQNFDFTKPYADFDIERICKYAKEKGVKIIGHHETGGNVPNYEKQLDKAYAWYANLGIHDVKTGYAGGLPNGHSHHGQYNVRHYRNVVQTAAKYHTTINAHEPIKATGIRRTYPNMMSREGAKGMEWNAWSDGNDAVHTLTLPFTRLLAGPMDYTPGIFDILYQRAKESPDTKQWNMKDSRECRIKTTLARQIAHWVILYSPIQMACDLIENYQDHPAFQFFRDFDADCDWSKAICGEPGEYIAVVRRSKDKFFLGAATDYNRRTLNINLDFLDEQTEYKAVIYADGKDAHWESNPLSYTISEKHVRKGDVLKVEMASGGGQAIYFEPINKDFCAYVDTHIGTGGHGHVFMGANVPFGMVQLGPTSIPQQWDWCSGYHESDSTVIGFSHTHLSGTGIGDLFDFTVMPVVGDVTYARGTENDQHSGLWSYTDRTKEISEPGYYSVPLLRYGIKAELTATNRVGFHRYTFPNNASEPGSNGAAIVLDLENGGCWDKTTKCHIEQCSPNAIRGYRYSTGWAKDQRLYFYAEFSKPFESMQTVLSDEGHPLYARFNFSTKSSESVLLKLAISPVSMDGAKLNMDTELAHWDFEKVRQEAKDLWNKELGKIKVESTNPSQLKLFYTSLYHSMIAPATFCDVNNDTRAADGSIKRGLNHTSYSIFSLWDTYRAAMPLYSIFQQERYSDFINTMLDIYDAQGKLPVWHLHGCETDCMVGNPGIPSVADAIVKGAKGVDPYRAFDAIKTSAMLPERGQDLRMKYGYIPCEQMSESVAYNLEYALADGAIANAAQKLILAQYGSSSENDPIIYNNLEKDYDYFKARSQSYKHNFDTELTFIRGRFSDGHFRENYSPFASEHRADDYCEGNGWQYTWLVPHDFKGLMECFGSKERLINKLDSLFTVPSLIEGLSTSPDISGLIGQYAHGNEPSHHILYFYTMAGQPWKASQRIREVLGDLYTTQSDGLAGNEDVGQMSSWYVMSSMGIYQVEPGSDRYWFGAPSLSRVEIELAEGKFTLKAENLSEKNIYIQSITLNGKAYTKPFLRHSDIKAGSELVFHMGPSPKLWYCPDEPQSYEDKRPQPSERLFSSEAVEAEIQSVCNKLENPRLAWMFANCFPNTLDTTVHLVQSADGPDTFVYTGDIPAMWLRDSGAQVWPYLRYANSDAKVRSMIAGLINRQLKCLNIDPYANAFNVEPLGAANPTDFPKANPYVFERKWELDSPCYVIRLVYEYWKVTGDESVFGEQWLSAIKKILDVFKEQQRKEGHGSYIFLRTTDRQLDTKCTVGQGNPVNPIGLIASSFRPSDDATTFEFLVPSNFMAVSSLKKAAEILEKVNKDSDLSKECLDLADEVHEALMKYAIYEHPTYGKMYAYEVDGFGSQFLMDDANVPSLLAMAYLGDVSLDDPIYQNTRRFVWSEANPYFHRGIAGEGIGGPHIWVDVIWPMSIMMKAFTSNDDKEIRDCIVQLMITDAGTGFMHESFKKDDASIFTREWFAWQNTLFGELILKLIDDGRLEVLNSII